MKKYLGLTLLLLLFGVISFSRPQVVAASTSTETVSYQVNKAGTTTPSLANAFFSGAATVTLTDGQPTSVTLHLIKFASYIKSFAIGTQSAKITNETANTADLTFAVDNQFAQQTVPATMSVMNMTQKADIVFAKALQQPTTQTVKFQVNKAGTTTPSLANSFFDHEATVTLINDRPVTVTLHLTKFASLIKSFAIGDQAATISNVTGNTADLTFDLSDQFANAKVTATMSVMNMTQQADLVFEQALVQAATATSQPIATSKPQQTATPVASKPSTAAPVQGTPTHNDQVSAHLYQANNGKLTTTPSAAQQFIATSATVVRNGSHSTLTLHTTGAEYIQSMQVAGQRGKIVNKRRDNADLIFTFANAELQYALPVTFSLSVPGAAQMTQSAFLLIDLAPQTAKVDPQAPQLTNTTSPKALRLVTSGVAAHAIDATKAQQDVTYSVLDASGNAVSTADQYFTHTAHIVKDATGYLVYLTVRVAAGVVQFTPQNVFGTGITSLTHTIIDGQDVWTFAFHVTNADALDQLVPATIRMSVPMANIFVQQFQIQLAFARLAQAGIGSALVATTAKPQAKAPINIKKVTAASKLNAQAGNHTEKNLQSDQALPHLQKYPIGWELLAFVVIDGLIIIAAAMLRRRKVSEAAHD